MISNIKVKLSKYRPFWRRILVVGFLILFGIAWWIKPARTQSGPLRTFISYEQEEPLKFLILGDTGSGLDGQFLVADAVEKRCQQGSYNGLILLGDNFYMSGVKSVKDLQWHKKLFGPYGKECLAKLPIYAILGNHDYKGNPDAQIEMHALNDRFFMPNRFYSVTFGKHIKFIMSDSNFPDRCFLKDTCMVDFVESELEDADVTWKLVLGHHPFENNGYKYPKPKFAYRLMFRSTACKGDIYMSGHSHHLEHLPPSESCQADLIVNGGGGASLYSLSKNYDPEKNYAESTHGFIEISVTKKKLRVNYFDKDLNFLYGFDKEKP